jgi:ribosomal protein S18 acetylase RimI-like enzyme
LQSCGLGTLLIQALEGAIAEQGLRRADLAVGDDNVRARALYERLGYTPFDTELDRWDYELADGTTGTHESMCTLLGKDL